jgi:hypothetical protein
MSGTKGHSGRKPMTLLRAITQQLIAETSPEAMKYLKRVALGDVKRPGQLRVEVCRYIVDQDVGRATQRIEHKAPPSAPLSWGELMKSAQDKTAKEEGKETADLVAAAGDIVAGKDPQETPETTEAQPPGFPVNPPDEAGDQTTS